MLNESWLQFPIGQKSQQNQALDIIKFGTNNLSSKRGQLYL